LQLWLLVCDTGVDHVRKVRTDIKYIFSFLDIFCDFQKDDCGFEIVGEGEFIFHREKGTEVAADVEADHNYDQNAYFLYAKWKG
jgi:hypothetical protein